MPKVDVNQAMKDWEDGLANAQSAYTRGIDNCDVDPMALAAAASDSYARGCAEAASSGKFAANVGAVPKSEWQNQAKTKGGPALAVAARNTPARKKAKILASLNQSEQIRQSVRAMPKGTKGDRQARYQKAQEMWDQFAGTRR